MTLQQALFAQLTGVAFEAGAAEATRVRAWFYAMITRRDQLVTGDVGARGTVLTKQLGAVIAKMVGPADQYTHLLGHGLDAAAAVRAHEQVEL